MGSYTHTWDTFTITHHHLPFHCVSTSLNFSLPFDCCVWRREGKEGKRQEGEGLGFCACHHPTTLPTTNYSFLPSWEQTLFMHWAWWAPSPCCLPCHQMHLFILPPGFYFLEGLYHPNHLEGRTETGLGRDSMCSWCMVMFPCSWAWAHVTFLLPNYYPFLPGHAPRHSFLKHCHSNFCPTHPTYCSGTDIFLLLCTFPTPTTTCILPTMCCCAVTVPSLCCSGDLTLLQAFLFWEALEVQCLPSHPDDLLL